MAEGEGGEEPVAAAAAAATGTTGERAAAEAGRTEAAGMAEEVVGAEEAPQSPGAAVAESGRAGRSTVAAGRGAGAPLRRSSSALEGEVVE